MERKNQRHVEEASIPFCWCQIKQITKIHYTLCQDYKYNPDDWNVFLLSLLLLNFLKALTYAAQNSSMHSIKSLHLTHSAAITYCNPKNITAAVSKNSHTLRWLSYTFQDVFFSFFFFLLAIPYTCQLEKYFPPYIF